MTAVSGCCATGSRDHASARPRWPCDCACPPRRLRHWCSGTQGTTLVELVDRLEHSPSMTTGGIKAADTCLFTSLTAMSARWPSREAWRCPERHQRARCTADRSVVGNVLSHSGQLCGRSRAIIHFREIGSRSRICTSSPFDLGADISIGLVGSPRFATSGVR